MGVDTIPRLNVEVPSLNQKSYLRKLKAHASKYNKRPSTDSITSCAAQIVGVTKGSNFAYIIHVETSTDEWVVNRRYSEFRSFRKDLFQNLKQRSSENQTNCNSLCQGTCQLLNRLEAVHFPRKHLFHANDDTSVIRQRTIQLNIFIQSILLIIRKSSKKLINLCEMNACQPILMIKKFLSLPGFSFVSHPEVKKLVSVFHQHDQLELSPTCPLTSNTKTAGIVQFNFIKNYKKQKDNNEEEEVEKTFKETTLCVKEMKLFRNDEKLDTWIFPPVNRHKESFGIKKKRRVFPPSTYPRFENMDILSGMAQVGPLYTILEEQEMHHSRIE